MSHTHDEREALLVLIEKMRSELDDRIEALETPLLKGTPRDRPIVVEVPVMRSQLDSLEQIVRNDRSIWERLGDAFVSLFRAGDRSKRPWLFIALVVLVLLGVAGYLARETWSDPEARAERDRRAREQFVLDSLKLEKELDALRGQVNRNRLDLDTLEAAVDSLAPDP